LSEFGRDITGDLDLAESCEWLGTNGIDSLSEIFDAEPPTSGAAAHFRHGRWQRRFAPGRNWRVARGGDSGKIAAGWGEPSSQESASNWR